MSSSILRLFISKSLSTKSWSMLEVDTSPMVLKPVLPTYSSTCSKWISASVFLAKWMATRKALSACSEKSVGMRIFFMAGMN